MVPFDGPVSPINPEWRVYGRSVSDDKAGVMAILAALAAFYPWELGKKADAFAPVPAGIRPEWYFLAMFHTLKLLPSHVLGIEGERLGVLGFGLAAAILVAIPFLDRRASKDEPSPAFTVLGLAALVYMIVFTIIGYYAS